MEMENCPLIADAVDRWTKAEAFRHNPQYVRIIPALSVKMGLFRAELVGFKKNGATDILPMSDYTTHKIANTIRDCILITQ